MKTQKGGFRLEIYEEGDAKARHGSIGVGLQTFIIKNTAESGIQEVESIRDEFLS